MPVLVMRGDQDHLVRMRNSDLIATALGVGCVVLTDTGHGLHDENPEGVVAELVSFLSKVIQGTNSSGSSNDAGDGGGGATE